MNFTRSRRLPITLLLVGVWLTLAVFAPLQPRDQKNARAHSPEPGRLSRVLLSTSSDNDSAVNITSSSETPEEIVYEDDDSPSCTPPAVHQFPDGLMTASARRRGGVIIHVLVAAYLFIFLAIVCDDYFVPSIKLLCTKLQLPEDVAGATLMAAATSSPELFMNCIGTFITEGDIGLGTVVGSGVFNILVVPACCGLFAGKEVPLEAWPVTRDCLAYGVSVVLLILALGDGRVHWYEAGSLLALYVLYLVLMCCGGRLRRGLRWLRARGVPQGPPSAPAAAERRSPRRARSASEASPLLAKVCGQDPLQVSGVFQKQNLWYYHFTSGGNSLTVYDIGREHERERGRSEGEEEAPGELCAPPEGVSFARFCWWLLLRPAHALLRLTVPDCRRVRVRSRYPITFLACVFWIALASYVVAWMITVIGDTIQIPDSIMGLTFLAAGTSLPEVASSVIVTMQGYGSMGISNSIGSNTFNILLCLGLPWLFKSLYFPPAPGQYWVNINSGGLIYNTMSLLCTLLLLYASFAYNAFKLNQKIGIFTLILYACFLCIAFSVELNGFGIVNLPVCPH